MNKKAEMQLCEQLYAKLNDKEVIYSEYEKTFLRQLIKKRYCLLENKVGKPKGAISKTLHKKYCEIYCEYIARLQSGSNKKSIEPELADKYGYTDARRIRQIIKTIQDSLLNTGIKRGILIEWLASQTSKTKHINDNLSEIDKARKEEMQDFLNKLVLRKTYSE